jgi:hypothetical protein
MNAIQMVVCLLLYPGIPPTTPAVPVILIFTKFDALDSIAFAKLWHGGRSFEEAEAEAPQHAEENFKKELSRFQNRRYPAKGVVYLRSMCSLLVKIMVTGVNVFFVNEDMHEEGQARQCSEIIQLTTDNLGNQTLQLLLVSVQQVNLKLCVKYALER